MKMEGANDMDFYTKIAELGGKIDAYSTSGVISTEEATKNALIMPLLSILGYDPFNPEKVRPEYTADVGVKNGEKVDYALMDGASPIMLIECKSLLTSLKDTHLSQLHRYFGVTPAKIGVLTNGRFYQFYTDSSLPNTMDSKPFLNLDLCAVSDDELDVLCLFRQGEFDVKDILCASRMLTDRKSVQAFFSGLVTQSSDELARLIYKDIYEGAAFSAKERERFTPIVSAGFREYVEGRIQSRLRAASKVEISESEIDRAPAQEPPMRESSIFTTPDEKRALEIVRELAAGIVYDTERLKLYDRKLFCQISYETKAKDFICRLQFPHTDDENEYRLLLPTFSDLGELGSAASSFNKNAVQTITLKGVEDLYSHSEPIQNIIRYRMRQYNRTPLDQGSDYAHTAEYAQ